MTRFSDKTIQAAFAKFDSVYASGWKLQHKNRLYHCAYRAFADGGDFKQFENVYNELTRSWGVRRKGTLQPAEKVFEMLAALEPVFTDYKVKRLRDFTPKDITELARLLSSVANIKETKTTRPSAMAMSKFLHFWNPRFFVMFDQTVMEKWVFEHDWLKSPRKRLTEETQNVVHGEKLDKAVENVFSTYIAVLWVCSECLNSNPAIRSHFFAYCSRQVPPEKQPKDLENYDALAIEWFLQGVTHLDPCCL